MRIGTPQIAKLLGISHVKAWRWCAKGKLETARRKSPGVTGSPWTAERDEVLQLREAAASGTP